MCEFSLCETITASGSSSWHLRQLTQTGPKYGGGADTPALCGREVSWDLEVPLTEHHLRRNVCHECLAAYQRLRGDEDEPTQRE